jgi:hypothetical protein
VRLSLLRCHSQEAVRRWRERARDRSVSGGEGSKSAKRVGSAERRRGRRPGLVPTMAKRGKLDQVREGVASGCATADAGYRSPTKGRRARHRPDARLYLHRHRGVGIGRAVLAEGGSVGGASTVNDPLSQPGSLCRQRQERSRARAARGGGSRGAREATRRSAETSGDDRSRGQRRSLRRREWWSKGRRERDIKSRPGGWPSSCGLAFAAAPGSLVGLRGRSWFGRQRFPAGGGQAGRRVPRSNGGGAGIDDRGGRRLLSLPSPRNGPLV